ncbi:DNA polymerase epsilon subunit 4 [Anoplophora glabripennis]|uniref:DNA polymerase epsilon subunit 4 n=1 Tax=Anoplophora glabripennis TaxID=217634 RepID=UPI0008746FDD|nr:DNA polymerase epsilon subunit 4 [Anoplophora glabripennis]
MEEIEVDIESEEVNQNVEENRTESAELKVTSNKDKESPQKHKFLRLPLARVKTIMKKDTDCALLSQDAVFLVTKATEMFIEYFASETGKQLAIMGKRKTVMRKDVDTVIHSTPQLCFLDGALD